MSSAAAPPPIAGTPVDPEPTDVPKFAEKLDRNPVGAIAYRALRRYQYANVGLLANGTAYFLLLSLLSVLAFSYGVITLVGADRLAVWLTDSLTEALPGLVGDNGIDPEVLRATGRAASVIGLISLLAGGLGSVAAAASSMHLIYGAPPDPRTFLKAKPRQLGILALMGPLMLLSLASASLASSLLRLLLEAAGIESSAARMGLRAGALLIGFALDLLIVWLLLGWLGGIRPAKRPRLIGSLTGAVLIGLIKGLLTLIINWVVAKPQYGAFAIPLAVLFVFSLLSQTLYIAAAVAAGVSDEGRPLEDLQPSDVDTEASGSDVSGEGEDRATQGGEARDGEVQAGEPPSGQTQAARRSPALHRARRTRA